MQEEDGVSERIFVLRIAGRPGTAGIHALRWLLKRLLRQHELRCLSAHEERVPNPANEIADTFAQLRDDVRHRVKSTSELRTGVGAAGGRNASAPRKKSTKMDMSRYAGSKYLKVADLKESGPFKAKIVEVGIGEKFDKPEIVFGDGSTLSLNATNVGRLIRHYGAESSDWIGKEIELSIGEVDYQGQPTEAILLRPLSPPLETKAAVKPAAERPQKRGSIRDDMDDTIPV
jgi:hypothetical protein